VVGWERVVVIIVDRHGVLHDDVDCVHFDEPSNLKMLLLWYGIERPLHINQSGQRYLCLRDHRPPKLLVWPPHLEEPFSADLSFLFFFILFFFWDAPARSHDD
jgi:hypothetical protein